MPEFLKDTEQEHKTIKKLYKDMETSLHETIKWFAMDPRKVTTEDFFTYFVKFITIFEKARKENEFIRETRKKEEHKREVEEAAKKKREKMKGREEQAVVNSEVSRKPQKGLLDDLLSKIEQGEVGPKKSGLQKKGQNHRSLVVKNKEAPLRQLSSVDEDKLREPEIKPINSTPRGYTNLPPLKETKLPYNSPQSQLPSNPILLPSYSAAPPQTTPTYNVIKSIPYNSSPKVMPYFSTNSQSPSYQTNPTYATSFNPDLKNPTSFNEYNPRAYTQEPEIQPSRPPLPKQIPPNEKYSLDTKLNPVPTTRALPPQIPDPQTNHYPLQRPKPPTAMPRVQSQPHTPQPDDTNGMSSDNTFSDKLAMFNKVGASRKIPSRNPRNVTEESTFF